MTVRHRSSRALLAGALALLAVAGLGPARVSLAGAVSLRAGRAEQTAPESADAGVDAAVPVPEAAPVAAGEAAPEAAVAGAGGASASSTRPPAAGDTDAGSAPPVQAAEEVPQLTAADRNEALSGGLREGGKTV